MHEVINMAAQLYSFVGGDTGRWLVERMDAVSGDSLDFVARINVWRDESPLSPGVSWILRGVTSYERYVTRAEQEQLAASQPALGRPEATCAALIPIKKSAEWWALAHDERRAILEERSQHIQTGLAYLPAVARRLHHCHDLGEPFDFLTWFEFAPEHAGDFDALAQALRASEEWRYVERELDIRLRLAG